MSGAVEVDLPAGNYRMTLGKLGYGAKGIDLKLPNKVNRAGFFAD